DMTPEMIERASINAEDGGYSQVEFRLGEAEKMPVDDKSVDWVISNCVINLSPDKTKVFKEIFRVLKSGGQFSISDIVIGDSLPKEIANSMSAWTGCIAGTIKETDYLKGLLNSGLTDVKVESRIVYDKSMMRGFIDENTIPLKKEKIEQLLEQVEGKIWSAKIVGKKN
ncbi:MAG: methyltransferase domain-containing protein, partial [Calditrichia bacterium]|nr:methyltransferase domain-containing protein [Calditrichia bacterium]